MMPWFICCRLLSHSMWWEEQGESENEQPVHYWLYVDSNVKSSPHVTRSLPSVSSLLNKVRSPEEGSEGKDVKHSDGFSSKKVGSGGWIESQGQKKKGSQWSTGKWECFVGSKCHCFRFSLLDSRYTVQFNRRGRWRQFEERNGSNYFGEWTHYYAIGIEKSMPFDSHT